MGKLFNNIWAVAILAAVCGVLLMAIGLSLSGVISGILIFIGGVGVATLLFVVFRAWVGDPIRL